MANFIKDWTMHEIELLTSSYKRYSYGVYAAKYAIPIIILLLILSLFIFSENSDSGSTIIIETVEKEKGVKTPQIMENPRFHGVDSRNQPYNIFAKSAYQETPNQVKMSKINADLTTENGSWVSIVADKADYIIDKQFLHMFGEVGIFVTQADFNGYEINTSDAKVDVKNRVAYGDAKLNAKSDMGDFTAMGFEVLMDEEKISFTGPIKLVIINR